MGRNDQASSVCDQTGVTIPECSCVECVEMLLRRFQPELLTSDDRGQISVGVEELGDLGRGATA